MARTSSAAKPLVSRGYTKIVFFTLLAMLIGVGLMAYEIYGEYGGETQAVRKTPPKVPNSLPPAEKGAALAPPDAPAPGP